LTPCATPWTNAGDVRVVRLEEVRDLAERALVALGRLRAYGEGADGTTLRGRTLDELRSAELLPSQLATSLGRPLSQLP
jgi:hypothetical protein